MSWTNDRNPKREARHFQTSSNFYIPIKHLRYNLISRLKKGAEKDQVGLSQVDVRLNVKERISMPFLLEPDNYARVHSLFEEMTCHLAALTVLAGIAPGRVYVDDPASPGTAILIPSNQHRVYVSGEPAPNMLADVIPMLFKQPLAESYEFLVYYSSNTWNPPLSNCFKSKKPLLAGDNFTA